MESFKNLTTALQLLLAVSSLSLLVTHYSSHLHVLVSLSDQFSSYSVDKNMVFLVCNGIILCVSVLPGSNSVLSAHDGQKLGEGDDDVVSLQQAVSSSSEEEVEVGSEVELLQVQIREVGLEVELLQEQIKEEEQEELEEEEEEHEELEEKEEEQEELEEEEEEEEDGDDGEEEVEGELVNEEEEESDERFENFIRKMREQMGFVSETVVLAQV